MTIRPSRRYGLVLFVVLALSMSAAPAWGHPHTVDADGDGTPEAVLANGQNHGPFIAGLSCGGDPGAYGLETAHHGPDAGSPGKADGCYATTGGVAPGADLAPASRVIK